MANELLIEKQTGGYFKFTLNNDPVNAITSIQNDLLAVGNQLHFKTGNGANIIKEQFIYPEDVTIVSSGIFTFTTVAEVWNKLIEIGYFAWLNGASGGVDRFDDLLDTFQYTGNAGKAVVVDGAATKLVPVTFYNKRLFTELEDTPNSLVPNKMVVVNEAGNSLILQDQPIQPEQFLNSVGYFDYNDLATQTTPLSAVANVALKLTNDTEGANTSTDQNPYGVSYVWDYTNNQFNFNELEVGDTIDVRIHVQVTTTTSNQRVLLSAKFGIGSVAEFTNIIYENQFKSAGLHEINFVAPFYMGSNYITDNPAELYLTSDASATVKVDGWYVRILRKNINIITVDYQVEDATPTVKGIVRLAGDLGGTANSPTVPELANKVPTSRTIGTTSPLLGGGALSSNLSLSIQPANSVDSGYLSYVDWGRFDEAHRDRIVSAAVTGTSTKTLTLTQHDAGTITTSWTDNNTGVWGTITGTLSSQTDLQNALDAKVPNSRTITINGVSWNLSSDISFTAGVWGAITGTLSSQTDLQAALNLKANDNSVVKLTGDQDISGKKSFNLVQTGYDLSLITSDIYDDGFISSNNGMLRLVNNTTDVDLFRLESDGAVFAKSFIKKNGTSSQYLMADGSVSTGSGGTVTGTGTTNYIPKFTGASAIGNSLIYDNGTNVGIGTASPQSLFHLKQSGTTFSNGLKLERSGATDTFSCVVGGDNSLYLGYGTTPSVSPSILAVITSGGNVGIGTTSPSEKLSVVGGNISLGAGYKLQYSSTAYITPENNVSGAEIATGGILTIKTGGTTERVRVDASGNVGIGTTSPSGLLHLQGNTTNPVTQVIDNLNAGTSAGTRISFRFQGTETGYIYNRFNGGDFNTDIGSSDYMRFLTGGSERMRITSGGNVGIGTTSPGTKLHINGGLTGNGLFIQVDGASNTYLGNVASWQGSGTDTNTALVAYNGLVLATNDTERMRITSGGNVLIGTTTDAGYKLDINGSARFSSAVVGTSNVNSNNTKIQIASTAASNKLGFSGGANNITEENLYVWNFTTGVSTGIYFQSNGTITASGGFFNSDIRLKELTDYNYNVSDIKPITYLWKDERDHKKHVGYSAQEVQKVMPDAVNEDENGFLSVNYVEVLVAKIAELENRIKQLEK